MKYARCDGVGPECIPTNDGPEATWYFDTFSANSLKCYDMTNLLLHPVLLIIVLLMNNKFEKVLNYVLNDQLHSHYSEISHGSFDSKRYKNKCETNIKHDKNIATMKLMVGTTSMIKMIKVQGWIFFVLVILIWVQVKHQ